MKKCIKKLEKAIGYTFQDPEWLVRAMTHRSYRFETDTSIRDNQRLEFLGDAVLGMITAEYLFRHFEDTPEGPMTCLRSAVTSTVALARLGKELDLGTCLQLGRGEKQSGGDQRPSNLADAMEAIIGAAYLDGGLNAATQIFNKLFTPELERVATNSWEINPKGALQEFAQSCWKISPIYEIIDEQGPPHARTFKAQVFINNEGIGIGEGCNKQAAEIAAAKRAIGHLMETRQWQ
jgi:ribonuclease-3